MRFAPIDTRLKELAMRRTSVVVTAALTVAFAASNAEAKLDLYIDKSSQQMSVVQNGYLLYVWPVSTGRDRFTTPSGIYAPERLERSWFSKAYYNAPMPYAIFFHNGYAIHGSYDIERLGGPASHGCIRLHPQNAAMLFTMVEREGPDNTSIVIGGDGPPNPQPPRYRDADEFRSAYSGDGGIARGSYPPSPRVAPYPQMSPYPQTSPYAQMSPYDDTDRYVDAPGRRRGDDGQLAMRDADPAYRPLAPYRDADALIEPKIGRRGSDRLPVRGTDPAYRLPAPRRDADASIEPKIGLRGSARLPMRGADPLNRLPALRRDAEASIEPKIGLRGSDRLPMRGPDTVNRLPAPSRDAEASIEPKIGLRASARLPMRGADPLNRLPTPRRDAEASIEPKIGLRATDRLPTRGADTVNRLPAPHRDAEASTEPKIGLRASDRPPVVNKSSSKCPTCSSNGEPNESANRQQNPSETTKSPPPASEQQQPNLGYKILPKSYWAGASWRWRLKSDQEVH
jgi:hypothetical protein